MTLGRTDDPGSRIPEPTSGSRVLGRLDLDGSRVSIVEFDPDRRLPRHYHDTACLTVVLDGAFAERFDRIEHHLDEGSILAKPAGEPHSDAFSGTGSRQTIVEYEPAALDALPPTHPFEDRIHRRSLRALALGRRLEREIIDPDPVSPLAARGLALELLALASRAVADPPRQAPPWLLRVRDLLHDRVLENPTCEALADEAGVHPATLSRAFRACFGIGMADYARRIRLEWAARELSTTRRPIAAIAAAAGFADQSHFGRWFRRFSGLTPDRYRRLRSR